MRAEMWSDIPGYEGRYQVSNHGCVRSLPYVRYQKSSHGTMMHKKYSGKMMTPTDNGNGYLMICLSDGGSRKSFYVHRLVADAFIPNPMRLPEINHIDYDKSNNDFLNLEWCTRLENIHHALPRMEKPRAKCKRTMTGEKYITRRKGKWRFSIKRKKIRFDRLFETLEEAIHAREVILSDDEPFTT